MPTPPMAPLRFIDKFWLALALVAILAFGALVVKRSALGDSRKTDAGVYFRAGWAVREGRDLYAVSDDNGWHYIYPSIFAITMTPLGDPPEGESRAGYPPYAVSVGVWYAISVATVLLAAHILALACAEVWRRRALPIPGPGTRAWWALRVWPVLAAAPDIGSTLSRGQTNLLILLLIACAALGLARARGAWAGVAIAGATCVKIIPAFVMLYALLRRDWKMTAGFVAGCVLGIVVIPAMILGPARMLDYNARWLAVVGLPGLGTGQDTSRQEELTGFRDSSSQSIQYILHNASHLTTPRDARPDHPEAWIRPAHALLGGGFTLLTCAILWRWGGVRTRVRRGERDPDVHRPLRIVLGLGMLTYAMLLCSPVTHVHYYVLLMPMYTGVVFAALDPITGWPARRTLAGLGACALALSVSKLGSVGWPAGSDWNILRDVGWIPLTGLCVWAWGVRTLRVIGRG